MSHGKDMGTTLLSGGGVHAGAAGGKGAPPGFGTAGGHCCRGPVQHPQILVPPLLDCKLRPLSAFLLRKWWNARECVRVSVFIFGGKWGGRNACAVLKCNTRRSFHGKEEGIHPKTGKDMHAHMHSHTQTFCPERKR